MAQQSSIVAFIERKTFGFQVPLSIQTPVPVSTCFNLTTQSSERVGLQRQNAHSVRTDYKENCALTGVYTRICEQ